MIWGRQRRLRGGPAMPVSFHDMAADIGPATIARCSVAARFWSSTTAARVHLFPFIFLLPSNGRRGRATGGFPTGVRSAASLFSFENLTLFEQAGRQQCLEAPHRARLRRARPSGRWHGNMNAPCPAIDAGDLPSTVMYSSRRLSRRGVARLFAVDRTNNRAVFQRRGRPRTALPKIIRKHYSRRKCFPSAAAKLARRPPLRSHRLQISPGWAPCMS